MPSASATTIGSSPRASATSPACRFSTRAISSTGRSSTTRSPPSAPPQGIPAGHFDVPRHGAGVWAPTIRHHAGKFWIFYPDPDFGLYVVTATDPRAEWSRPVLVKGGRGLIDPCPLWDDDGRTYLVHAWAMSRAGKKNLLQLNELSADGTRVLDGDGVVIVDENRSSRGFNTLEGPKLYKRGDTYWIFAPIDGVATGSQAVYRAKNIRGPTKRASSSPKARPPSTARTKARGSTRPRASTGFCISKIAAPTVASCICNRWRGAPTVGRRWAPASPPTPPAANPCSFTPSRASPARQPLHPPPPTNSTPRISTSSGNGKPIRRPRVSLSPRSPAHSASPPSRRPPHPASTTRRISSSKNFPHPPSPPPPHSIFPARTPATTPV
jgi:hypothetical protein